MRAYRLLLILVCLAAQLPWSASQDTSTCKRCRAFALQLTCQEESDKVKMRHNGHSCAAKTGSNVKLKCNLDDSDGLQLQYEWFKSNTVSGKSFRDETSGAAKINDCTTNECDIYNVRWKDSTDVTSHDSFFYQCIVTVTPNSSHSPVFFSNAFPLSVQSYTPGSPVATTKQNINIGTSEVKLPCTVPKSNPPSQAVWYYASSPTRNRTQISGNMNDMFVINGTLVASDVKYGYSMGMLVIMKFKAANFGSYTCVVQNTNAFGEVSSTEVSTQELESTGVSRTDVEELLIVSHVTGPPFLFTEVDETSLSCFGASYIAGVTAHHYWQKTSEENGVLVYKNLTGSGFKYANQNRTLVLDYNVNNVGVKYRCQIQKGSDTLLLNDFVQAPIIPKTGIIPSDMTCTKEEENHIATANNLMNADPKISSVQTLAGSSYFWHKQNKYLTKFESGYDVSGTQLSHKINSTENCHYVQQFRYIKDLYAIQQIHAVNILSYTDMETPKIEIKQTGGVGDEPIKIECKATASYSSQLENKVGLNVQFDVGGCIEYTDALVTVTPGKGTCDKTVTRTLTLNKKVMCKDCIVKCMATSDCKSSNEVSVTIEPAGTNCEGETGTTTGSDSGLPGWGIALIVLAIILGLISVSAIFFYTYMQKAQSANDAENTPQQSSAVQKSDEVETGDIVKVIPMSDENEGSPADIL